MFAVASQAFDYDAVVITVLSHFCLYVRHLCDDPTALVEEDVRT